jgi:transglutaminase-like putative cysteine protease
MGRLEQGIGRRRGDAEKRMHGVDVGALLRLRVGCRFAFESPLPAASVFLVQPRNCGDRFVQSESWTTEPLLPLRDYTDGYGNLCRRMTLPAGAASATYDALVVAPGDADESDPSAPAHDPADLPDETLVYTLPSRYCLSDTLAGRAIELFGGLPRGWGQVQAVCDWVHQHVQFAYGSSTPLTTAVDVLERGVGVCRDYAHLAIAFCRALNVPARYAFGYLPDIDVPPTDAAMDFAAWFEAYLGGRWWIFDPRNNERRKGRITIAYGRDALDVAMVTTYGLLTLREMTVWTDLVP